MASTDELRPEALLEHAVFVRALARRLLRDPHKAEDVVQETWLAALRRPPGDRTKLRAWLGVVARRLALRKRRSGGRRRRREERAARGEALASTVQVASQLEVQRDVVAAVMALEEPYRSTVVHRFLHGHTVREIAAEGGISPKTVESRLTRALNQLRARLDRECGGRQAWCAALVPLVWPRKAAASVLTVGGVVTAKVQLTILAAALVVAGVAVWAVRPSSHEGTRADRESSTGVEPATVRNPATTPQPERRQTPETATSSWASGVITGDIHTLDGEPLPNGTKVSLAGAVAREVEPDAEGRFRFTELRAGRYRVAVDAEGYAPLSVGFTVRRAAAETKRTLYLGRGAEIRFRVRGVDDRPVEDFGLTLAGQRSNAITVTDERGAGNIAQLPDGNYTLKFQLDGRPQLWQLYLQRDRRVHIDVVPGAKVAGQVLDTDGHPAKDATVLFKTGPLRTSTTTDEDGRYMIAGLGPGAYETTVTGAGFAANGGRRVLGRKPQTAHDIRFGPGSIAGRVTSPLDRSWVLLTGAAWLMTRADEQGRFIFWGLATGKYRLKPTGQGGLKEPVHEFTLAAREQRTGIELVCEKRTYGYVDVDVRSKDGAMPQEPQFAVSNGIISTRTAAKEVAPGRFRLRLETGALEITVSALDGGNARFKIDVAEGSTQQRSVELSK